MQIFLKLDDFFYNIFPETEQLTEAEIINKLEEFYSYGNIKPKIKINNGVVTISIDSNRISSEEKEFNKATSYCEKGQFDNAKPILQKLIKSNPSVSEYYRVLGQVFSEEGDQEEAINHLIDALRWDSKNTYALIMVGNIYAKYKDDVETARNYYDQVLVVNPNDFIAMNNIGGQFLQSNKFEEAKKYFWDSIKINSEYSNPHYALSMIAEHENDFHSAFYSANKALKLCNNENPIRQNCLKQCYDVAVKISTSKDGVNVLDVYRHKLEKIGGGVSL